MGYKKGEASSGELSKAAQEQKVAEELSLLYKKAKSLEKGDLTSAGILYAQLSNVGAGYEKYVNTDECKEKAENIVKKLAGKKDDLGAASVLSYLNKEEAADYARQLQEKGRYGSAGLAYLALGDRKNAEDMVTLATKKGDRTGAMTILEGLMQDDMAGASKLIASKYELGRGRGRRQQGGQDQQAAQDEEQDEGYAMAA